MNDAVEKVNMQKLLDNCGTMTETGLHVNTKSKYINDIVSKEDYTQWYHLAQQTSDKNDRTSPQWNARVWEKFQRNSTRKYRTCESTDDENHRINECSTWKETNYLNKEQKPSLDDIFSREFNVLNNAIKVIQNVWEVKYANGRMRKMAY